MDLSRKLLEGLVSRMVRAVLVMGMLTGGSPLLASNNWDVREGENAGLPDNVKAVPSAPSTKASTGPRSLAVRDILTTGGRVWFRDYSQPRADRDPEVPSKGKIEAMKILEGFMSKNRLDTKELISLLKPKLTRLLSEIVTSDQIAKIADVNPDLAWQKCKDIVASLGKCFNQYSRHLTRKYLDGNHGSNKGIPSEILYIDSWSDGESIRVICLLNEFIGYYLEDHPVGGFIDQEGEVMHSLMWNVPHASIVNRTCANRLNPINGGDVLRVFMRLIKYLVHGVCLNTVGAEKILNSFNMHNLLPGRVGIKDFCISLCGLIGDTINGCDSEDKKFEKLAGQIQNCFDNCCELPERCSVTQKRNQLQAQNSLVHISDWHHIPPGEPDRVYRFVDLVLRYYGGDWEKYKDMTLSRLPGNVADTIRPYIMLLNGDPSAPYTSWLLSETFPEIMEWLRTKRNELNSRISSKTGR